MTKLALTTCTGFVFSLIAAQAHLILEEVFPVTNTGPYIAGGAYLASPDSPPYNATTLDYRLYGKNPSTNIGFGGAWAGSNAQSNGSSAWNVSVEGLSNSGGSGVIFQAGNYGRTTHRPIATHSAADTMWFSTVVNVSTTGFTDGSANTMLMAFLSGTVSNTSAVWSNTNGTALDGFGWGFHDGNLTVRYQSDAGGSGSVVDTTIFDQSSYLPDTSYLLLAELLVNSSGSNDTLNIWAVSSLPESPSSLGAPTLQIQADVVTSNSWMTSLAATFNGTGSRNDSAATFFDAIRAGTTLADVTPVPEPSTWALLVLGFLGAAALRNVRNRKTA